MSPEWRPERGPLSDSTDWITGREPLPIRAAPMAGFVILIAIMVWATLMKVESPVSYPVSLVGDSAGTGATVIILLGSVAKGSVTLGGGSDAVLRLQEPGSGKTTRIRGVLASVEPSGTPGLLRIGFRVDEIREPMVGRTGTMLVFRDRVPLIRILYEKIKSQRGIG
jgi:hypothetical protein